MDDFLSNLVIRKRRNKACHTCKKEVKLHEGEIFCKECLKKNKKIQEDICYKINYSNE